MVYLNLTEIIDSYFTEIFIIISFNTADIGTRKTRLVGQVNKSKHFLWYLLYSSPI